jgi:hypothetical protein
MADTDIQAIKGQHPLASLGPLDNRHGPGRKTLFREAPIHTLNRFDPIPIDMKNFFAPFVFVNENKGGAGDLILIRDTESLRDPFNEGRLSSAQIPLERHDIPRSKLLADSPANFPRFSR